MNFRERERQSGKKKLFLFLYLLLCALTPYSHILKQDLRSLKLNALEREWL